MRWNWMEIIQEENEQEEALQGMHEESRLLSQMRWNWI